MAIMQGRRAALVVEEVVPQALTPPLDCRSVMHALLDEQLLRWGQQSVNGAQEENTRTRLGHQSAQSVHLVDIRISLESPSALLALLAQCNLLQVRPCAWPATQEPSGVPQVRLVVKHATWALSQQLPEQQHAVDAVQENMEMDVARSFVLIARVGPSAKWLD